MRRYSDTIRACALDVDISLMAGGDMAHIGSKGINLSGGQRARLALARLYSIHLFILASFSMIFLEPFLFLPIDIQQGHLSRVGHFYA